MAALDIQGLCRQHGLREEPEAALGGLARDLASGLGARAVSFHLVDETRTSCRVAGSAGPDAPADGHCDAADPARLNGGESTLWPLPGTDGQPQGWLRVEPACGHAGPAELALRVGAALEASRLRARLAAREEELREAQERIAEEQALRDNFVANVSHELRTPLTSMVAYAEMLERSAESLDPPTLREFGDVIRAEGGRLGEVFDRLLDVAELEGGRGRLVRGRFDLAATCEEVLEERRPGFVGKGVGLEAALPAGPVEMHGDRAGCAALVGQLLANALKFTPAGGSATLELDCDPTTVRLAVADRGIGLPAGARERVFDRFFQVDGSSTRDFGGQGLGLSICRDVARGHHGRIWAEANPGGGSRFVAVLPRLGFLMREPRATLPPAVRGRREATLQALLAVVGEALDSQAVSLMLADGDTLAIEAAVGLPEDVVRECRMRPGEGVAGEVFRSGRGLVVPELGGPPDPRYPHPSLLSVPLQRGGRTVGVLNVNRPHDDRRYADDDLALLEAIAGRAVEVLARLDRWGQADHELGGVQEELGELLAAARERRSPLRQELHACALEAARRLGLGGGDLGPLAWALRSLDPSGPGVTGPLAARILQLVEATAPLLARGDDGALAPLEAGADADPVARSFLEVLRERRGRLQSAPDPRQPGEPPTP